MSLLDSFYKKYNIMNQTVVDDPEGGWVTGWTPGATVEMALDDPTQTQRVIAEAQKIEVIRTANFPIGTPVKKDTYLRAADDEKIVYRLTEHPYQAPEQSTIRTIRAEVIETRLPA